MRRIVTAITAATLALSLVAQATPANAVAGYDSAYAGESAFLTLNPGQSNSFTVFFQNTGTTTWTRGTATQVDLIACLENKLTCDQQDASEAPFNSGWLSATRYATHTQTSVAPGSIGTFTYNVAVPAGQAAGTYRFNGDLAVSALGAGGMIHQEGYYQDVTVPTAVGSCTPTAITTTPTFAQNQVGITHTQSVTVTCADSALSANTQVTFVIDADAADTGNADQTLTATTNASGVATVSWTRSNPGTDSIAAYPTATPAVRATAVKRWTAAAAVLTCTPTDAATLQNGTTRAFTVTVRNPSTGALVTGQEVDLGFSARTANVTGGSVTMTGTTSSGTVTASAPTSSASTVAKSTTDANGAATFTISGTDFTITPRVFVEGGVFGGTADDSLGSTEYRVTCGATTFASPRATITVTPDTTATNASGGQRVYTVSATDQFGNPFTGPTNLVDISFVETTDDSAATTTTAVIVWYDNDSTLRTTSATGGGCTTVPSNTTQNTAPLAGNTTQRVEIQLNASGQATFAICATATGTTTVTATPVAWQDITSDDDLRQTDEPQDTGGAKTWAASALSGASMSPTAATNPTSTSGTETTNDTPDSFGEETFTLTFTNQSGNAFTITDTSTVQFTVQNTGSGTVYIVGGCGVTPPVTVAPGATTTVTCVQTGASTATITVDSAAAGSARITGAIVGTAFSATGTKTWVLTNGEPTNAAGTESVSGTVAATDTTQDFYVINAGAAGYFVITYGGADQFRVDGSTTTIGTFETNLTVGDAITWTRDAAAGDTEVHALTNQ